MSPYLSFLLRVLFRHSLPLFLSRVYTLSDFSLGMGSRGEGVLNYYTLKCRVLSLTSLCYLRVRGDVAGALSLVLDGAPYGPNVEEAKVCCFVHQHWIYLKRLRSN